MSSVLDTASVIENIVNQIPGAKVEWLESNNGQAILKATDHNNSTYTIEVKTDNSNR